MHTQEVSRLAALAGAFADKAALLVEYNEKALAFRTGSLRDNEDEVRRCRRCCLLWWGRGCVCERGCCDDACADWMDRLSPVLWIALPPDLHAVWITPRNRRQAQHPMPCADAPLL